METTLRSSIDHLVVTAASLEAGTAYVQETLGIILQPGGAHPRMGTHNRLLKLGESLFLEVIAINPTAALPDRPRWFALDERPKMAAPSLRAWVAKTNDIFAAQALAPEWFGAIEPMSRGDLNWLITITDNGRLSLNGLCPLLIQWQTEAHPAVRLADSGCFLIGLEGYHANAIQLNTTLERMGFEDKFLMHPIDPSEQPYFVAHIQTPAGVRRLVSG
jgi:hypothetical protein